MMILITKKNNILFVIILFIILSSRVLGFFIFYIFIFIIVFFDYCTYLYYGKLTGYSHLMGFRKKTCLHTEIIPDVILRGDQVWEKGSGFNSSLVAVKYPFSLSHLIPYRFSLSCPLVLFSHGRFSHCRSINFSFSFSTSLIIVFLAFVLIFVSLVIVSLVSFFLVSFFSFLLSVLFLFPLPSLTPQILQALRIQMYSRSLLWQGKYFGSGKPLRSQCNRFVD
jgi:hypothetical protein